MTVDVSYDGSFEMIRRASATDAKTQLPKIRAAGFGKVVEAAIN